MAHEEARQPPPHFSGDDLRRAFKKLTENDPRLQAGECGQGTEVRVLAEGDAAPTAGSVESELVGIVEVQWIVRVGCRSPIGESSIARLNTRYWSAF